MFRKPKDSMKGKYYVFCSYKQRNKEYSVYFEWNCKNIDTVDSFSS